MFGLMKEYTVATGTLIKNIVENSFSINPCDTYRENDNVGQIYISKLTQFKYSKLTDSVKIIIDSAEGNRIANVNVGIRYLPLRGQINQVSG